MTSFRDDVLQTLLLALFATIIGFGVVMLLVQLAPAASLCLSKKEARELWPRRHLYWYSKDHCWSNRRGPPRNIKIDPVINSNAQAIPIKSSKPEKTVSAPLDSRQPLTIEKDFCCWPDLKQLELDARREHYKRLKSWLEYKP